MQITIPLKLNTPVLALVQTPRGLFWKSGTVVGRTREASPYYDVRLYDGTMMAGKSQLPASHVKPLFGDAQ